MKCEKPFQIIAIVLGVVSRSGVPSTMAGLQEQRLKHCLDLKYYRFDDKI
jgi:hypothetical protein